MSFLTAQEIDALLAARKTVFDQPQWEIERGTTRATLTASLAENGVVIGGVSLRLSANVHTIPQRGSAVLICDNRPVQRMNVKPNHNHSNPLRRTVPKPLRGLSLPQDRSRIYRWAVNRVWPRPPGDNLAAGELIDPEPDDFSAAVRFFLQECGISGTLPAPPWEPRLSL